MNNNSEKPTLKQRRKAATKLALVEAAETVFGEKGFGGATMQDIAQEAGCAAGTLYLYFESKDALFSEIVLKHTLALTARLEQALTTGAHPADSLREKTRALLEYFNQHRAFFRLFYSDAAVGQSCSQLLRDERAKQIYLNYKECERKIVAAAQQKGQVRQDLSDHEILELIHGTSGSTVARWSNEESPPPESEQFRILWSFLSGALAPQPLADVNGAPTTP